MCAKALDISSDFLGYTVSGDYFFVSSRCILKAAYGIPSTAAAAAAGAAAATAAASAAATSVDRMLQSGRGR
jgi:hypothetical protein